MKFLKSILADHWKILTVLSAINIVADVGFYLHKRVKEKKPIFTMDIFKSLIGRG